MVIRIYGSLAAGFSRSRSLAVTRPLLQRLSDRDMVGFPIEFDIFDDQGPDGLKALGAQVADGTVHIGVLWGIEYGWIRQRYPNLQPLAIAAGSDVLRLSAQLVVRRDTGVRSVQELPNPARMVKYRSESLIADLFLRELQSQRRAPTFQSLPKVRGNLLSAVNAVLEGHADCLICDPYSLSALQQSQPGRAKRLEAIQHSDKFPEAVLVGDPQHINRLRPGLWDHLQKSLIEFSDTTEGRELISYWKMQEFQLPPPSFLEEVALTVKKYPAQ